MTNESHLEAPRAESLITKQEVDFLKEYAEGFGALKAQAAANYINFPNINIRSDEESESDARKRRGERTIEERKSFEANAELGAFEYKTAKFLAHQFKKSIDGALAEGVLKEADVKINVIDGEDRVMLSYEEYAARLEQDTSELRIVGVFANVVGDENEGANILLRNDIDALRMDTGEIKHQCGHNVHSGWALSNLDGLIGYKRKFGNLPFKQIVFVSESNEEGNPTSSYRDAPNEMIRSGFLERYGNMDYALGVHVTPLIPEHIISFDEKMYHGGMSVGFDIVPSEGYSPENDSDYHLVPFEIARLTNEKYHSDEMHGNFGKMTLEENSRSITPSILVRTCDIKETGQMYSANVLPRKSSYEGLLANNSIVTDVEIRGYIEEELKSWRNNGFEISSKSSLVDGKISLSIDKGDSSHIAAGGPNPHVILAKVLRRIEEKTAIKSASESSPALYTSGTSRVLERNYDEVQEQVGKNLDEIAEQALKNLGLVGKVTATFGVRGGVKPVLNSPKLVEQADLLLKKAGIEHKDISLPAAPGESFSSYKNFLKPNENENFFYFNVGALKKEIADELMKTKMPVPSHTMHHSDDFYVQDSALPYGILVVGFALEFAKQYLKDQKK